MKKTKYFDKSSSLHFQPDPYFLYELPKGSFMSMDGDIDVAKDSFGEIIRSCSGNRIKDSKKEAIPEKIPKHTIKSDKNLLQLNTGSHYWHLHHETIGQFLLYKDLGVLEKYTPENTAILMTWCRAGNVLKEVLRHIFNFNIDSYELIFAERDVLYTTKENLVISTKTSTAGCLPLSYFSEKLEKYLIPEENPTDFIYVGRDDSDCRLLLNQEEILQFLNENDIPIRKITLTGMPYIEQVQLFRNAKFVMVIGGTGSTNQIYCNPNKAKILFVSPKNGALQCSQRTAKGMNMAYSGLEGYENFTPTNKARASDPTCANFKLRKEDVLKKIQSLL